MAIIETSVDINASVDKVWAIISDLDNEPKFWKGTKETKIISRDGNVVTREIIIAFSLPLIFSVFMLKNRPGGIRTPILRAETERSIH